MAKKKVALSAGHGFNTAGKRCLKSIDPNETREWVLNARIADKVTEILKGYNCEVVRLDDPTGKTDVPLKTRAEKANSAGVDLYVAIHHNAGINGGKGGGVMVYYYPKGNNKAAATSLYNHVVAKNGLKGNRVTPIQETKSLYECKTPKATSVLLENGFMDSLTDTPQIISGLYAEHSAQGIADFIVEYLGLTKVASGTIIATGTFYKIKKGDTLTQIAKKYGTTVEALVEANNLSNANKIYVGQILVIKGAKL